MAKNPSQKQPVFQSKKHLARQQRERLYRRWILIITAIVVALVAGLLAYGILNERVFKARQPVATVNGERISATVFQAQTRFARQQMINNAMSTYQFIQYLGNSPDYQANFASQLAQIQSQLEPNQIGEQQLNQLVDDALIRQEAQRRGITVSDAEIEKSIQDALGYFPDGTPTPKPTLAVAATSTLSALQRTLAPPTAAPTETAIPSPTTTPTYTVEATQAPTQTATITPTEAPTATPTEYTREGFDKLFKDTLDNWQSTIQFTEKDLRFVVAMQLYREKVEKAVLDELGVESQKEEVWARHILVTEEAQAQDILDRVNQGEDWSKLAAEFSTDTSNKDNSGDLGWFGREQMVPPFENAAFSLQAGEIVSRPVQTTFGYHIIQVLGHELRPLDESAYQQLRSDKFTEWLQALREKSEITLNDIWRERVPTEPTLPAEVINFITAAQQQSSQAPVLTAEAQATPGAADE
jgi:parvulin-like peptidyl-prolyl isomerase